jgi:hypothetical protein
MSKNKAGYINTSELAREAALEALREFRKEERAKVKKTRFHNTGLLMDHYLEFIDYYEKIKCRASDIVEDLDPEDADMIEQDDIIIYSIKRSKIRTKIMINQIDAAVAMVHAQTLARNEKEKYKVIELLYMDRNKQNIRYNQRIQMVAEEISCSESSVRRWSSEMLNEISEKLFGVDGLRLEL